LNLGRRQDDFGARGTSLLNWNPIMSKVAQISHSFIASTASRKSASSPLDPVILFSGICLIGMVTAFAFGEPGLWY
jgi:hypothetical protein